MNEAEFIKKYHDYIVSDKIVADSEVKRSI